MDQKATTMTIALTSNRCAPTPSIFAVPHRRANVDTVPLVEDTGLQKRAIVHEDRFVALHAALARHGGCVSADDVCTLLRPHWAQPLSRVARWIARREVASLTQRGQWWLPLFQFERPSLDLVPAAGEALRTLRDAYDDFELVEWFVRPHALLGGRCPAVQLTSDPHAVNEAARVDRFINRW